MTKPAISQGGRIRSIEHPWASMFAAGHAVRSQRKLLLEAIAGVDTAGRDGAPSDQFLMAVDANRNSTVDEAIRFARLIEPLDSRWFEEPCQGQDDVASIARVRQKPGIPVTAAESEITSQAVGIFEVPPGPCFGLGLDREAIERRRVER